MLSFPALARIQLKVRIVVACMMLHFLIQPASNLAQTVTPQEHWCCSIGKQPPSYRQISLDCIVHVHG